MKCIDCERMGTFNTGYQYVSRRFSYRLLDIGADICESWWRFWSVNGVHGTMNILDLTFACETLRVWYKLVLFEKRWQHCPGYSCKTSWLFTSRHCLIKIVLCSNMVCHIH